MPIGPDKREDALLAIVAVLDDGELALFDNVPVEVSGVVPGTEVTGGGYARQSVSSADWSIVDGALEAAFDFGPASAEWDTVGRFWLWVADDVVQAWGALRVPVNVETSASAVPVTAAMVMVDPTDSED